MTCARWPRGRRPSPATAGSPRTPAGARVHPPRARTQRGCAEGREGDRSEGRGAESLVGVRKNQIRRGVESWGRGRGQRERPRTRARARGGEESGGGSREPRSQGHWRSGRQGRGRRAEGRGAEDRGSGLGGSGVGGPGIGTGGTGELGSRRPGRATRVFRDRPPAGSGTAPLKRTRPRLRLRLTGPRVLGPHK